MFILRMMKFFIGLCYVFIGIVGFKIVGVRVLVVNEKCEVFLVKYIYMCGWYFFGGGVDCGEIFVNVVKCELIEEIGYECIGWLEFIVVYYNCIFGYDDFLFLFLVKDFVYWYEFLYIYEIFEIGWFLIEILLDDILLVILKFFIEYRDGME